MPLVLADVPYYDREELFFLDSLALPVKIWHRQIPVRISLRDARQPDKVTTAGFPAVLDTGFNGTLATSTFHLRTWAKLSPTDLGHRRKPTDGARQRTIKGFPAEVHECNSFWIHPNIPGAWNSAPGDPHRFDISGGVFVVTSEPEKHAAEPAFRLPLLCMRAFEMAASELHVDYANRRVRLTTKEAQSSTIVRWFASLTGKARGLW